MVEVQSFLYNNHTVDDGEHNFAIFDSYYGGIHLPYSEFDRLATMFKANVSGLVCDMGEGEKKCWYEGKCAAGGEGFNEVYFNFLGNTSYKLKPSQYLYDIKNASGHDVCHLLITGNHVQSDKYLIGNIFMR